MTFDNVFGVGTIKTDLYDPANIPSSTDVGNGKVSVITNTFESISTIGSVIDLSVDMGIGSHEGVKVIDGVPFLIVFKM